MTGQIRGFPFIYLDLLPLFYTINLFITNYTDLPNPLQYAHRATAYLTKLLS